MKGNNAQTMEICRYGLRAQKNNTMLAINIPYPNQFSEVIKKILNKTNTYFPYETKCSETTEVDNFFKNFPRSKKLTSSENPFLAVLKNTCMYVIYIIPRFEYVIRKFTVNFHFGTLHMLLKMLLNQKMIPENRPFGISYINK